MQYIRLNSSCETQIILTEILEINKTHTHTHTQTHIYTHTHSKTSEKDNTGKG